MGCLTYEVPSVVRSCGLTDPKNTCLSQLRSGTPTFGQTGRKWADARGGLSHC
jgi:hypothetical protein